MRNTLVGVLSLITFEAFSALPPGAMLKFENPDQMIQYIKIQTRDRERLKPGDLQAIVEGIKDHEPEKQKQFRDCLNYFSAVPDEQFEQFNKRSHADMSSPRLLYQMESRDMVRFDKNKRSGVVEGRMRSSAVIFLFEVFDQGSGLVQVAKGLSI